MAAEIDPEAVAKRLAILAELYVPETVQEGFARMRRDMLAPQALAAGVARRLEELRALDDLTRYLHKKT